MYLCDAYVGNLPSRLEMYTVIYDLEQEHPINIFCFEAKVVLTQFYITEVCSFI